MRTNLSTSVRHDRVMLRRYFAVLGLAIFLGGVAWIVRAALEPEALPIGTRMPLMTYETSTDPQLPRPNSAMRTLVVLFEPDCEHCQAELNAFEQHIQELNSTPFVFISPPARDTECTLGPDIHQRSAERVWCGFRPEHVPL